VTSGRWRGPGWRLFNADPACGKTVRDWIRYVVASHPCPADPADAALVASELFANAVMHGPSGGQVFAGYVLWPHGARVIVCDGGGITTPRLRDGSGLEEGGRGLHVVDALSAQWGSFRALQAQVVWCDLGQPMHAAAGEAWAWLSAALAEFTLAADPGERLVAAPSAAMRSAPRPCRDPLLRGDQFAGGGS
jgi:anti-sigma regulatory factor (Ser/Thr protein kinase)